MTEDLDKNKIFVVEASKSALIATACTIIAIKTPCNKSSQHHHKTTNPSSLRSPSLPSTSLPPLSPSSKEQT